ncbi:MAG: hypothetical protein H6833_06200 [Planctomycetes bacterium]|nr:hypothetical protein [Planctomycetota bacterium]
MNPRPNALAAALAVFAVCTPSSAQSITEFLSTDRAVAEAAWVRAFPDLATGRFGMDRADVPELRRLFLLVTDPQRVQELLQPLNERVKELLPQGRAPEPRDYTRALSAALTELEGRHGFARAKILPLGILPPEVFHQLPALGYAAKDPGAGIEHGEFSHRLQWAAIMQSFEQSLRPASTGDGRETTWARTPFELYTGIGARDLAAGLHDSEPKSLWAHLVDQQGIGADQGYRQPDEVTEQFRGIGSSPQHPLYEIGKAVEVRYQKRFDEVFSESHGMLGRLLEINAAPPAQRQVIAEHLEIELGPDGKIKDVLAEAKRLAAELYTKKKEVGGRYKLFDPDHPERPLLIRKGDRRVYGDRETQAVARRLRREVYRIPLHPSQLADAPPAPPLPPALRHERPPAPSSEAFATVSCERRPATSKARPAAGGTRPFSRSTTAARLQSVNHELGRVSRMQNHLRDVQGQGLDLTNVELQVARQVSRARAAMIAVGVTPAQMERRLGRMRETLTAKALDRHVMQRERAGRRSRRLTDQSGALKQKQVRLTKKLARK